ncbi:MAG TPA: SagB/ThcOx family dehydrogenase, partial [bacterium]|nr:SagB/ThcOx family dehydrogenase [bacterium]
MTDTGIKLPSPQLDLDFPLMKALAERRSKRKWKAEPLSLQGLSNLLWAACGITRQETDQSKSRRTAPSASNTQAIRVYVALPQGVFLYDETEHSLMPVLAQDIRESIGTQAMMHSAPVGLIYVADYSRMKMVLGKDEDRRRFVAGTDTGFISQNVYLYCAA